MRFLRLPMKIGPDGVIRVFDSETNTFGSYNMNGTTKTFFRPWWSKLTRGLYWEDQLGNGPWTPEAAEPEVEPELEPEIPIEPIP